MYGGLNKPLDIAIENGCKKIVFGEQIHWFPPMGQRADLHEKPKKNCGVKNVWIRLDGE